MVNRDTVAGLLPTANNEEVKARAFELLKKIRSVALATINGDKPAVRIVRVSAIRDDRIYFLAFPRNTPVSPDHGYPLRGGERHDRPTLLSSGSRGRSRSWRTGHSLKT